MLSFGKTSAVKIRPQRASSLTFSLGTVLKPLLIVPILLFGYVVYHNWQNWLEKLDSTPIQAYALTNRTQFTTNADIRETLARLPNLKGYFGQNIQEIEQVLRQIPWVKDVVVRKMYPDRLGIGLVEYRPVAVWNELNFLSDQGIVFSLPKGRFEAKGLPILSGPDSEAKKALEAWAKITQDLKVRNLELKSLALDNRGAWEITLSNDVVLKLGRGDWLPKIDRFILLFPQIEVPQGKRLDYVDLRYEHGAAVGFSQN